MRRKVDNGLDGYSAFGFPASGGTWFNLVCLNCQGNNSRQADMVANAQNAAHFVCLNGILKP